MATVLLIGLIVVLGFIALGLGVVLGGGSPMFKLRILLALIPFLVSARQVWAGYCWCNPTVASDEVQVFLNNFYSGSCFTLAAGDFFSQLNICPTDFSNQISSLKVGVSARLLAYAGPGFTGEIAVYEGGSLHTAGVATSHSQWIGSGTNNNFESLIAQATGTGRIAYNYWGNFPSNRQNFWSHEAQGLCHNSTHWFVTANRPERLIRIPHSGLDGSTCPGCPVNNQPAGGYNHFGDPDCTENFVLVPNDGGPIARVEIWNTSDMLYVGGWELAGLVSVAWVALRPGTFDPTTNTQELWAGGGHYDGATSIQRYRVDFDFNIQPTALGAGPLLRDDLGNPITFSDQQGAVFNGDGTVFYMTYGLSDCNGIQPDRRLWAWQPDGFMLGESGNAFGRFNYQTSNCSEEPEGLDWFETTMFGGVPTALHVILLDNDRPDNDDVYLKHYRLGQ